jgi:3-phenylpropionate/cinnamic acid dioxygenase small subunit
MTVRGAESEPAARAIESLIYRYAEKMDAGDFAGVAALFEGATYGAEGAEPLRGAAAVEAALARMVQLYDGQPATRHVTTNVVIELSAGAGEAAARSYFTVLQALGDFPLQTIVAGRYRDRFACENGIWRFAERVISMDLVGDLSRHLLGAAAHLARSR